MTSLKHNMSEPISKQNIKTGYQWGKTNTLQSIPDKTMPKISIVTPSYNQGKFLEQTIRSVLEQNYPNLQYIIIDGGSTDESLSIIKKYEASIDYWVSEKDAGQADALIKGFSRASGEILAWINSDDYYEAGVFSQVAEIFKKNPFSFLCGASRMIDMNDKEIQTLFTPVINSQTLSKFWKPHFCPPQPSMFFLATCYHALGGLNPKLTYAMDFDLWVRAAEHFEFRVVPNNYSYYRIHDTSKSGSEGGLRKFIPEWKAVIKNNISGTTTGNRVRYKWQRFIHRCKSKIVSFQKINFLKWTFKKLMNYSRRLFRSYP